MACHYTIDSHGSTIMQNLSKYYIENDKENKRVKTNEILNYDLMHSTFSHLKQCDKSYSVSEERYKPLTVLNLLC